MNKRLLVLLTALLTFGAAKTVGPEALLKLVPEAEVKIFNDFVKLYGNLKKYEDGSQLAIVDALSDATTLLKDVSDNHKSDLLSGMVYSDCLQLKPLLLNFNYSNPKASIAKVVTLATPLLSDYQSYANYMMAFKSSLVTADMKYLQANWKTIFANINRLNSKTSINKFKKYWNTTVRSNLPSFDYAKQLGVKIPAGLEAGINGCIANQIGLSKLVEMSSMVQTLTRVKLAAFKADAQLVNAAMPNVVSKVKVLSRTISDLVRKAKAGFASIQALTALS